MLDSLFAIAVGVNYTNATRPNWLPSSQPGSLSATVVVFNYMNAIVFKTALRPPWCTNIITIMSACTLQIFFNKKMLKIKIPILIKLNW